MVSGVVVTSGDDQPDSRNLTNHGRQRFHEVVGTLVAAQLAEPQDRRLGGVAPVLGGKPVVANAHRDQKDVVRLEPDSRKGSFPFLGPSPHSGVAMDPGGSPLE